MEQVEVKKGYFGEYGGQFVPGPLLDYLNAVDAAYNELKEKPEFKARMKSLLSDYAGRPSPLYFAEKMSEKLGYKIYFKREDLNHTGAHKINNTLGQALLAKYMGMKEVVAETGAGQHGVATATAAALVGLKCTIYMGEIDAEKQKMNVYRMKLLGADVHVVKSGDRVLKDAIDEALMYLVGHPGTFYLLGSAVGPHPYPTMVRDFQKIIGEEAKKQIMEKEGRLPDCLVACVGGGSNALGLFYDFIKDEGVRLVAVEPAGKGLDTGLHAATLTLGTPGVIHGFRCYLIQDENGNPGKIHSIASGLDYPGVSPEFSNLKDIKRLEVATISDEEALDAFDMVSREEGIIPALETAHAIAYLIKEKDSFGKDDVVILNFSGRGDKDVETVFNIRGRQA
ncbi:MAG: tryptophan synthase subunit beta [Chloroflexi bacterium]|nr:tryptophan synthase subunit beta [Chloroflexota bacterium]